LADGKVSKTITTTERISSTMTEKTKSHTSREGRESHNKPSDDECMELMARRYEEFI
jgi:hypothetical protein